MKVIVCSDSHGNMVNLRRLVVKERPELLLHLGDTATDAERLQTEMPELPMRWVVGNCDGWDCHGPAELCFEVLGRRIFMLHGHTAHVKVSHHVAVKKATGEGAAILLFGHTHIKLCRFEAGLWLLNPGSIRAGDYGVIHLTEDKLICHNAAL